MKHAVLWACAVLAGCHAGYDYRWHSGPPVAPAGVSSSASVGVSAQVNGVPGAVLFAVILADGIRYYLRLPEGTSVPYERVPDGERSVNIQDCTQAIDLTAGNLMCR